jgi:hypothetical protein
VLNARYILQSLKALKEQSPTAFACRAAQQPPHVKW